MNFTVKKTGEKGTYVSKTDTHVQLKLQGNVMAAPVQKWFANDEVEETKTTTAVAKIATKKAAKKTAAKKVAKKSVK